MSDAADGGLDRLALADWRRRVGDLYAEVRSRSSNDPRAAWTRWREVRDDLYRTHPASPVPEAERAAFEPRYWPYDERLRFRLEVQAQDPEPEAEPALAEAPATGFGGFPTIQLPMSVGAALDFTRIGWLEVPLPGGARRLAVYWMAGYAGGLFLPFRDATSGESTYGAGRYVLDAAKSADLGGDGHGIVIDFNFAYQPSCAFDPQWSCPLAPPENRLDLPIEAGERLV
jgi:uncharacterized protein (DUF1684 family)